MQQCDVFGSVAVDVVDLFSPGEVGSEGQVILIHCNDEQLWQYQEKRSTIM